MVVRVRKAKAPAATDSETWALMLRMQRLGEARGLLRAWCSDPRDYLTARHGEQASEAREWVAALVEMALAKEGDRVQRAIERNERRKGQVA